MSTFNELIDFTRSTTGTYLDSVVYGDELVVNGTFDTDSDWTVPSAWDISAGVATATNADGSYNTSALRQPLSLELGKLYKVSVDVSSITGQVRLYQGVFFSGLQVTGAGVVTGFLTGEGAVNLNLLAIAGSSAVIDNVSVKEVIGGQVSGTPLLRTAAINEPRLEYDASGNPLGLLIEEARTNILVYSENFTSGWSSPFCDATANAIASPDGALSGAKLQEDSSGVTGPRFFPNNNAVLTANQAQTLSCFFKAGTSAYAYLTIRYSNGNVAAVEFDLTSGTVNSTTVSGNMTLNSSDITSAGNGWYRCSVTATSSASTTGGFYFLAMTDGSGVTVAGYPNYTLTGKNIYAWGAQVEAGSFPTSYIPTSGSAVTRAADVASLPVERFAYNQTQGSVVVSADSLYAAQSGVPLSLGNFNNGIWVAMQSGAGSEFAGRNGSATQFAIELGSLESNTFYKTAGGYKTNDSAASRDGSAAASDTSCSIPVVSKAYIGSLATSSRLHGHIKSIQYYPKRLSNEELELLTQPSASPTMNLTFDGQATSTLVEGLHD